MLLGFHVMDEVEPLFAEPVNFDSDSWFTQEEQGQSGDPNRAKRVLGHLAAKKALVQRLGVFPCDITIEHYPSGTPFAVVNGIVYPVSISHVRGWGAVLTTEGRHVGIDIDYDRGRDLTDLIERVASPQERLFIGENRHRFIELWTLKEAALKAWGVGMRVAPWDVSVDFSQGDATLINAIDYPQLRGTIVHVSELTVGIAWSDGLDQRVDEAYQQPRGLHIGC